MKYFFIYFFLWGIIVFFISCNHKPADVSLTKNNTHNNLDTILNKNSNKFNVTVEELSTDSLQPKNIPTGRVGSGVTKTSDLISVNKESTGVSILNNSSDSVKIMLLRDNGDKNGELWLEQGDFYSISYQKIDYGKYTLFISGKYDEIIKLLRIVKSPEV